MIHLFQAAVQILLILLYVSYSHPTYCAFHHFTLYLPNFINYYLNKSCTLIMFIPTHLTAALSVSITVDYTPPPDAVLGENEYRAASSILLTCEAEDPVGSVGYAWDTSLGEGSSSNQRSESILGSEDAGGHTCTVVDSTMNSGSATIEIIVVGKS